MVLTPTYYVFDMYKVHEEAKLLPIKLVSPDYVSGSDHIPAVNASASKDSIGSIHISLVNIDPSKTIIVHSSFAGTKWTQIKDSILTSENFNDYNSFENPNKIKVAKFLNAKKENGELIVNLPPKSLVVLELI